MFFLPFKVFPFRWTTFLCRRQPVPMAWVGIFILSAGATWGQPTPPAPRSTPHAFQASQTSSHTQSRRTPAQTVATRPASPSPQTNQPRQIGLAQPSLGPIPGAIKEEDNGTASVIPPLSIYESCLLLSEALQTLTRHTNLPPQTRANLASRTLQVVSAYVEQVDRAYPTLPYYAWEDVSNQKAPKSGWGTLVFKPERAIPEVTALSLVAHHGDLEIKYLAAIDQNKTKWEFNQLISVPADQPRPEICFLPLPTRLAEVRVICRRVDPKSRHWGRLFVDGGICTIPESAKQANYHLKVARDDLKNNKQAPAAIKHIQQAYSLLKDYQRNRRL